ncbi:hypothetical protein CNR22_00320 [Sphingobacteriaceae bacterium]|nr:hypothetical protein CNR22_00320 [Sphingobacteriaceae bacterium]
MEAETHPPHIPHKRMKKLFFSVLLFYCLDLPAKEALVDSLAQHLKLAKSEANYEKLKNLYRQFSSYYETEKDYKKAYTYSLLYQNASDSLLSNKSNMEQSLKTDQKNANKTDSSISSGKRLQQISFSLLVIASAGILLLLFLRMRQKRLNAVFRNLLEEQDSRSRSIIEAEEKERVELVRELNEGIGQQISAARIHISALQTILKTENGSDKRMLQNAVDILDDSVKEVRNVTQKMLPNVLVKAGLVEALKSYTSRLSSEKTKIHFESYGSFERKKPVSESVLYRVVVELITNALRHAEASVITVQIIRHERELSILVEDNGIGFDVKQLMKSNKSNALKGIESRVEFLKGVVFFDSCPTKGTTVTVEIPL